MVTTSDGKHVRHELSGDGCSRLVLLVHAGVREAGDDSCDTARGCTFASGDEDEQLHKAVVHVVAPRLDDEDVFIANRLGDFDVDLAVRKLLGRAWGQGNVEPEAGLCESPVLWTRRSGGGGALTAPLLPGRAQGDCCLHKGAYVRGQLSPEWHGGDLTSQDSDRVSVQHVR